MLLSDKGKNALPSAPLPIQDFWLLSTSHKEKKGGLIHLPLIIFSGVLRAVGQS